MTSHDIRKMKLCVLCKDVGFHQVKHLSHRLPIVICLVGESVPKKHRQYAHPQCYLDQMGLDKLLTVPAKELGYIRLCDVSSLVMQRLLSRNPPKGGAVQQGLSKEKAK